MFPVGPSKSWRASLAQSKAAIREGRLDKAVQIVRRDRLHVHKSGQRLISELVDQLLRRASAAIVEGKVANAWNDLTSANEISLPSDRPKITSRSTELVELTIHQAETFLKSARPKQTISTLRELSRRRIADQRADQLFKVASAILQAEEFATAGKFRDAARQLQSARSIRTDLSYVDDRMAHYLNDNLRTKKLTKQLKRDLLQSRWNDAQTVSSKLLRIAPDYRIALDALKRCFGKAKSKSPQKGETQEPKHDPQPESKKANSFLLWIDGAGGYLICKRDVVVIGQAIEQSNVDIPIQGDISRRHMAIRQNQVQHILEPWADVSLDGKKVSASTALRHNQNLCLGGGVELKYQKPHPLSSSARLELASRHRTQPWSDAIILMSDLIVIGPTSKSHIQCPELTSDIVLFLRDGELMCRCGDEQLEIDGVTCRGQQPITNNSRIVGEEFSIVLEPV